MVVTVGTGVLVNAGGGVNVTTVGCGDGGVTGVELGSTAGFVAVGSFPLLSVGSVLKDAVGGNLDVVGDAIGQADCGVGDAITVGVTQVEQQPLT